MGAHITYVLWDPGGDGQTPCSSPTAGRKITTLLLPLSAGAAFRLAAEQSSDNFPKCVPRRNRGQPEWHSRRLHRIYVAPFNIRKPHRSSTVHQKTEF